MGSTVYHFNLASMLLIAEWQCSSNFWRFQMENLWLHFDKSPTMTYHGWMIHIRSQCLTKMLFFPIGSMVLVYMLTFGLYSWDPCYHIYSSTMDPMGSWIHHRKFLMDPHLSINFGGSSGQTVSKLITISCPETPSLGFIIPAHLRNSRSWRK